MRLRYKTNKLERLIESDSKLLRKYGSKVAKRIQQRIGLLLSADSMAEIPTTGSINCHPLVGNRKGQFAINLTNNYRLVFEIDQYPIPRAENGGIDFASVMHILIVDIVDYH